MLVSCAAEREGQAQDMTQAPAGPRSRLVFPGLGTALPSQPVVFGVRQHLAPLVAVDFTGVVVVREHVFPRLLRPCDALPPSSARLGSRVMSLVRSRHMVRGTALSVDTSGSVASAGNPWDEGSRPVLWVASALREARPGPGSPADSTSRPGRGAREHLTGGGQEHGLGLLEPPPDAVHGISSHPISGLLPAEMPSERCRDSPGDTKRRTSSH